jgi:amino acid transporter
VAMFGSLILLMVTWAFAYNAVFHGFGGHGVWNGTAMAFSDGTSFYPFGGSDANHAAELGAGLGAGREPFPTLMLAFTNAGPVLILLFALGFSVSTLVSAGGLGFAPIRNVFAWSFDRLIPTKFAELDSRYRAPWLALCSVTFVAWLFFLVDVWKPEWGLYISFTIAAWMIGWLVLGISGLLFPIVRPQLFDATPPLVQRGLPATTVVAGMVLLTVAAIVVCLTLVNATVAEILLAAAVGVFGVISLAYVGRARAGTVPYISILGWATFAIAGFIEWSILVPFFPSGGEPAAQKWTALSPVPIMVVCPFIIYGLATYAARRRQIPLKLQFAQIPPE